MNNPNGDNNPFLTPMLETKISRKIFLEDYDDYEQTENLEPNTAVIILNPTKYTLQQEDDEESSLA